MRKSRLNRPDLPLHTLNGIVGIHSAGRYPAGTQNLDCSHPSLAPRHICRQARCGRGILDVMFTEENSTGVRGPLRTVSWPGTIARVLLALIVDLLLVLNANRLQHDACNVRSLRSSLASALVVMAIVALPAMLSLAALAERSDRTKARVGVNALAAGAILTSAAIVWLSRSSPDLLCD